MPTLARRKLIKFGEAGLVLTVLRAWARYYNLKPGDRVEVEANGELVVRPQIPKGQANEETDK